MKKAVALIAAIMLPALSIAEQPGGNNYTTETFTCQDFYGAMDTQASPILLTATVHTKKTKNAAGKYDTAGQITFAGVTMDAVYSLNGLTRNWDFGPKVKGNSTYLLTMTPNGKGHYYDFSSVARKYKVPSSKFQCKKQA